MPLTLFENQHLAVNYTGEFPDKLVLKKALGIWPLVFTYSFTWGRQQPSILHKLSCKDSVFRGKFNINNNSLEYRKRFHVARLGANLPGSLVVSAKWNFDEPTFKQIVIKPIVRIGLEFHDQIQYTPPTGFTVKPKFFVTKTLGFKMRTNTRIQLPQSLNFSLNDAGHNPLSNDGGSVSVDISEFSVVLRL